METTILGTTAGMMKAMRVAIVTMGATVTTIVTAWTAARVKVTMIEMKVMMLAMRMMGMVQTINQRDPQ